MHVRNPASVPRAYADAFFPCRKGFLIPSPKISVGETITRLVPLGLGTPRAPAAGLCLKLKKAPSHANSFREPSNRR